MVVLEIEQYDALMEELELIREIREARAQLARGEGIAHDRAMAERRARVSGGESNGRPKRCSRRLRSSTTSPQIVRTPRSSGSMVRRVDCVAAEFRVVR